VVEETTSGILVRVSAAHGNGFNSPVGRRRMVSFEVRAHWLFTISAMDWGNADDSISSEPR
jgi:hypothetical protein